MHTNKFTLPFRLLFVTDGEDGGGTEQPAGDKGDDLGFPPNTPAKDMTPEQQAAYYKHLAKKHEKNAKALLAKQRPDDFDQIVADAEAYRKLQDAQKSPDVRALEAARKEAAEKAAAEAAEKFMPVLVRAEFARRLPTLSEEELDELLEDISPAKYFKDGEVDKERVERMAARLAPAPAEDDESETKAGFTLGTILAKTSEPKKGAGGSIQEARERARAKYPSTNK